MAGNFWLLPQKGWKAGSKSLKSKQAKLARAKIHLVSTKPLLFTAQCQALPWLLGQFLGVVGQTLQYPAALPSSHLELIIGSPHSHLILSALSLSCKIHSYALGFAGCLQDHRGSSWPSENPPSGDIRPSASKNSASEESFPERTGYWREGLRVQSQLCCHPHKHKDIFSPFHTFLHMFSQRLQEPQRAAPLSTRYLAGVAGNM